MTQNNLKRVVAAIKSLKILGASKLRKAAVRAMQNVALCSNAKTAKEFKKEIEKSAVMLLCSRPTEPGMRTAIRIILKATSARTESFAELKKNVVKVCENYESDREKAMLAISDYGSNLIEKGSVVFTHCHSHTVEAILLKAKKKIDCVFCTETRPMFQGRITATNLSRAGLDVVMVVDSAANKFMHQATLFLTGADAILNDGSVVNKIGTSLISLSAHRNNVPHFVATSSHCFDPMTYFGVPEQIEERCAAEVWNKKMKNFCIRNPAFDITPAELIKGIITEKGVFSPENFAMEMYEHLELEKKGKDFLSLLKLMKK